MTNEQTDAGRSERWQRRERRRKSERERVKKHGASLKRVYADAVRKRMQVRRERK